MSSRYWNIFFENSTGERLGSIRFTNFKTARLTFDELEPVDPFYRVWLVRNNGTALDVKTKTN